MKEKGKWAESAQEMLENMGLEVQFQDGSVATVLNIGGRNAVHVIKPKINGQNSEAKRFERSIAAASFFVTPDGFKERLLRHSRQIED